MEVITCPFAGKTSVWGEVDAYVGASDYASAGLVPATSARPVPRALALAREAWQLVTAEDRPMEECATSEEDGHSKDISRCRSGAG